MTTGIPALKFPSWAERLLIQILEEYLTPEILKDLLDGTADEVIGKLSAAAKHTDTKIDDKLVAIIAKTLGVPVPS